MLAEPSPRGNGVISGVGAAQVRPVTLTEMPLATLAEAKVAVPGVDAGETRAARERASGDRGRGGAVVGLVGMVTVAVRGLC